MKGSYVTQTHDLFSDELLHQELCRIIWAALRLGFGVRVKFKPDHLLLYGYETSQPGIFEAAIRYGIGNGHLKECWAKQKGRRPSTRQKEKQNQPRPRMDHVQIAKSSVKLAREARGMEGLRFDFLDLVERIANTPLLLSLFCWLKAHYCIQYCVDEEGSWVMPDCQIPLAGKQLSRAIGVMEDIGTVSAVMRSVIGDTTVVYYQVLRGRCKQIADFISNGIVWRTCHELSNPTVGDVVYRAWASPSYRSALAFLCERPYAPLSEETWWRQVTLDTAVLFDEPHFEGNHSIQSRESVRLRFADELLANRFLLLVADGADVLFWVNRVFIQALLLAVKEPRLLPRFLQWASESRVVTTPGRSRAAPRCLDELCTVDPYSGEQADTGFNRLAVVPYLNDTVVPVGNCHTAASQQIKERPLRGARRLPEKCVAIPVPSCATLLTTAQPWRVPVPAIEPTTPQQEALLRLTGKWLTSLAERSTLLLRELLT